MSSHTAKVQVSVLDNILFGYGSCILQRYKVVRAKFNELLHAEI